MASQNSTAMQSVKQNSTFVRLSVSPSHTVIVSKRLNQSLCNRRCCTEFSKHRREMPMASPPSMEASNAGGAWGKTAFLANVNSHSRSRSLFAVTRPSVCLSDVRNVRASYSGGSNFRQHFHGIRYLGHPLTSTENFTEIVPGEQRRRGS